MGLFRHLGGRAKFALLTTGISFVIAVPALAGTFTIFDQTLVRRTGEPQTVTFEVPTRATSGVLHIESHDVASAVITLNGATIVAPNDFTPHVTVIERRISLIAGKNQMTVEIRGEPEDWLQLRILGIDNEPPVITATVDPPANAAGWHRGDARVVFTCKDAISGIASCPDPVLISTEGAGQVVTGRAVDVAGNTAEATVTINLDRTAPTITPTVAPPANSEGWHNTDPTVSFTCTDALSGIAQCPAPQVISDSGSGRTVAGTATDLAGNTATATATVNLDKASPTITAHVSPSPNADGWHNAQNTQNGQTPVVVSFTCGDSLSGIARCPDPITVTTEGANQEITGVARDRAGNTATASVTVRVDLHGPTVIAAVTPAPTTFGWHADEVTISFACSDAISGVASCPALQAVTVEGITQVTVTATDRAGNTAEKTETVNIDRTAPTITATIGPAPNGSGWNNAAATVTFACADALSGVAECPPPVVISEATPGTTIEGTVRDRAGRTATTSVIVKVDMTPPSIQAFSSATGVTNGDVIVHFECSDAESGIKSCPEPVVVSTEGLNQSVAGTAYDRADNAASAGVTVSIDRTAPTIVAALEPAANGAGWNKTAVTVRFSCSDTGSGVATCSDPVTISQETGGQQVSGEATDRAGNSAAVDVTVRLDMTKPTIVPQPSTTEWTNGDVSISFICNDALSGIAQCQDTIGVKTEGIHDVVGAAMDVAGNTETAGVTVRVDKTPPAIQALADRPPNAAGWYNAPITVSFACSDALSGMADCPAPATSETEGASQRVARTARDVAGNTAEAALDINLDRTAPTVQAIPDRTWSRTDVTVAFQCEDALSGIARCPSAQVVSGEGAHVVAGTAVDVAGNPGEGSATVHIDTTAPTITARVTPAANAAGWYNGPVTVTFECADPGGELASCSPPVTITSDGAAQLVSGVAQDRAGNSAAASVMLNVDATAPLIRAVPSSTAAWNREDVTVSFECSDALSGIVECPSPTVVSAEGALQAVQGSARDLAGNSATAAATVNIDRTPPTVQAQLSPAPNGDGWNNTPVTVTFVCNDLLSGVASCPPATSVGSDGASQTVSGTAYDAAGNAGMGNASVNLDLTPPVISIASPAAGSTVRTSTTAVSGAIADSLSGVAEVSCNGGSALVTAGNFSCTVSLTSGSNTISITARDRGGNQATQSLQIAYDPNAEPVARIGGPYSGDAQRAIAFDGSRSSDPDGATLSFAWEFGDGSTGTGAVASHAFASPGTYTVRLTVTDADGASNSATTTAQIGAANRAPTASAGGPYTSDVGTVVTFDASASSDPDNDVLGYAWTFGDGSSGTGQRPQRAYSTPGTYTARLTVTDNRGGSSTAEAQVTIRAANQNPIADPGGPYSGPAKQAIAFSGSRSHDPDNDALTFSWNFGDGSTGTGAAVSHAFASAGSYLVSLTVTDGRGGSASASTQVEVAGENGAPKANAGGPYSGEAGSAIAFTGGASSDPDSDVLTYSWSFGDGRSATGVAPTHAYDVAGIYTVSLTVSDGRGGSDTATSTATISVAQPRENRSPIANAGGPYSGETGIPIAFDGRASTDPDGDALIYAWSFGDGATGAGPAPAHAYAEPRTFDVTLTVTDVYGASHQVAVSASILTAADRAPPVVALSGPREVLPGTEVTITADANDNVGVSSVTFEVQGSTPSTATTPPYQRAIQIPPVGSPGDTILVKATAADAAGNTGSGSLTLTIVAQPDTEAPQVALNAPPSTSPGATLTLSAAVTDNSGVAGVLFRVNGTSIPAAGVPYSVSYAVPSDIPSGAVLQVVAEAADFAGNRGTSAGAVTVGDAADTTPPTVALAAPETARPDTDIQLTAQATDDRGIATVTILVDGVAIARMTQAPYEALYRIPSSAPAGMQVRVEARATDFAGLSASASGTTTVSTTSAGGGLITGEVYDDSTGLPLEGASITLVGEDSTGTPYAGNATSDARGRFVLAAAAGDALVRVTRSGWTTVDRPVAISATGATELFDARLTPFGSAAATIAPVTGGTLSAQGVSFVVPAGAVSGDTALRLTIVGPQGLRGLLPLGWSPISTADVSPADVALASDATLSVPRGSVEPGTPIVVAQWDAQRRGWRAIASLVAADAAQLQTAVTSTGQFAWLRPDVQPAAPPAAVTGELIGGVSTAAIPDDLLAKVEPQPKVIFYQPGAHAETTGSIQPVTPLSSGVQLWSKISESYKFFSGAEIRPEPYVADLIFYQASANGTPLNARYTVTPSMSFEALTLEQGVITAELHVPPESGDAVLAIDGDGGSLALTGGERIEVAAGSTDSPIAVQMTPLTAAEIGVPLPSGFDYVGGVLVSFAGGTLSKSALLSVPRSAGLPDGAQVLIARADTILGQTKLVLVAIGTVTADAVISQAVLPRNGVPLEGVRAGGRYVFLRPTSPVGFVAGLVLGPTGTPFAGAQISTGTLPIFGLSRAAGVYVVAAAIGAFEVTALDPQKADTGSAHATLAAAGDELAIDLRLVAQPPRVLSVSPANGAQNVSITNPLVIVFSEPVTPESIGNGTSSVRLVNPAGEIVPVTAMLAGTNTTLTLRPVQPLAPNSPYTLLIEHVKDPSGYELPALVVVQFATLDTTAPPPPAPGALTATLPENGTTTITATQAVAGPRDTVTIENLTRGTSTPVLLDPNLGFIVIVEASATDKLKLKVVDPAGNVTLADVPRFTRTNADGSISSAVGPEGGLVLGPAGVGVNVPAGAFPQGAVLTLKSVSDAEFGVVLDDVQRQGFAYSGGLSLTIDGPDPKAYLNVSMPAPPNATKEDQWVLTQRIETPEGIKIGAIDTARVIAGRITTSSPPCPGVTGNGVYGFLRAARPLGVIYGTVATEQSLPASVFAPFLVPAVGVLTLPPTGLLDIAVNLVMSQGDPQGAFLGGMEPYFGNIQNIVASWPKPVCMPLLSGRVTAVANRYKVIVPKSAMTPADQELIVTHDGVETHAYAPFPDRITIEGDYSTGAHVQIVTADGTSRVAAASLDPMRYVKATVEAGLLQDNDVDIEIRNTTRNVTWSSAFNAGRTRVSVRALVEGTPADTYVATVRNSDNVTRTVAASIVDYPLDHGNLVIRAIPGTVDPTQAEIDEMNAQLPPDQQITGSPLTKVILRKYPFVPMGGSAPDVRETIFDVESGVGAGRIATGAFVYVTNGPLDGVYGLVLVYANGNREEVTLPNFRIVVRDPNTGAVRRTLAGQVPPRGEPLQIDTTDPLAPLAQLDIDPNGFVNLDPRKPLTVRFTQALNPDTVAQYMKLLNADGTTVAGHWVLSEGNKVATFVPEGGIRMGTTYRAMFGGVTTANGNAVPVRDLLLRTFAPRQIGLLTFTEIDPVGPARPVEDLAFMRRGAPGAEHTFAYVLTGRDATSTFSQGSSFHAVDLTNARQPVRLGHVAAGTYKKQIALVPNALVPLSTTNPPTGCNQHIQPGPSGWQFQGDLAITSSWNIYSSYITFLDITDPASPCAAGDKTLAANPDQVTSYTKPGTQKMVAYSKGVTWLGHERGVAAYMGAHEGGLFAVDVGKNIPSVLPEYRKEEGFYPGDYFDVEALADRILAVNGNYGGVPTLDVFDPNLGPIASVPIDDVPVVANRSAVGRLALAFDVLVDRNGDGQIAEDEILNLAFTGTSGGVSIFDITERDRPTPIGQVRFPGPVWEMAVSSDGRTLYAAAPRYDVNSMEQSLFIVDVSNPFQSAQIDADNDGLDDRIVYVLPFGRPGVNKSIGAIRADLERGLIYVGSQQFSTGQTGEPFGLEVWAVTPDGLRNGNRPPVADAGPDQVVPRGTEVRLDGSRSSEPDGDQMGYRWSQISGPPVTLSGTTTVNPKFTVPSNADPSTEWVFQLIVTDGMATSQPDLVKITVKRDELILEPTIIPIPLVGDSHVIKVTLKAATGTTTDVTTHPDTTYEWVGNGIGSDLLVPIVNYLNSKVFDGALPFRIIPAGDIQIAGGQLTAASAGVQLVRAKHGNTLTSDYSVVIVGIKLVDINLKPHSAITTLTGMLADALGSDLNPPLILAVAGNSWMATTGVVLLDDMVFEVAGGAKIRVRDLLDGLKSVIEKPLTAILSAETGPIIGATLAKAFLALADAGLGYIGTQFLDPLTTENPAIATVTKSAPFKGIVSSGVPGLTTVTGTLNLGRLGEASDSVFTLVLADLESVWMEPQKTVISAQSPAIPGPTVRSYATVSFGSTNVLPVPAKLQTMTKFLDKAMPGGLANWVNGVIHKQFQVTYTPPPPLRFSIDGGYAVGGTAISVSHLTVSFPVPNKMFFGLPVPGIDNTYTIADQTIAKLGAVEPFDVHLVHQGKEGETGLHNRVDITLMNPKEADGLIKVVDGPYLVKFTSGGIDRVAPGAAVPFDIVFSNPTTTSLNDVRVVDEAYFRPAGGTAEDETVLYRQVFSLGTVAAGGTHRLTTTLVMPNTPGMVRNVVKCDGDSCKPDTEKVYIQNLRLKPVLIFKVVIPEGGAKEQLHAYLNSSDGGSEREVTDDPDTTYHWVGSNTGFPAVDQKINEMVNDMAAKLGAEFKIAQISVDQTGMATILTPGVQVIFARHKGIWSNPSIVLAGLKLKSIDLKPHSAVTDLVGILASAEAKKNPPLILAQRTNALPLIGEFLSQTGEIVLDDAEFEYLGGPTIRLSELAGALAKVLEKELTVLLAATGPVAPVTAKAIVTLMGYTAQWIATQMMTFEMPSEHEGWIATLLNRFGVTGMVSSGDSGVTRITGTLDLGALGKAKDNVLTWVMPNLERATISPDPTFVYVKNAPQPGPAFRTFATMKLLADTPAFELTGKAKDGAELLNTFLPGGFAAVSGPVNWEHVFTSLQNFRVKIDGQVTTNCAPKDDELSCTVRLSNFFGGFTAPRELQTMTLAQPSLADLVPDGGNVFDTHVVHKGLVGQTTVKSVVSLNAVGWGDTTASAQLVFYDDTHPSSLQVYKRIVSPTGDWTSDPLVPGEVRQFDVTVINPVTAPGPVDNAVIRDTLSLDGVQQSVQSFTIPHLNAGDSTHLTFNFTVPQSGTLLNTLACVENCVCDPLVCAPLRLRLSEVMLNEVVTEPLADWNTDGRVDVGDQWIEVWTYTGTRGEFDSQTPSEPWTGWRLDYTDASGVLRQIRFHELTNITFVGNYMLIHDVPGGLAPNAKIELHNLALHSTDASNTLVDDLTVTGHAREELDEAFARVPDWIDSDRPEDFKRRRATPGAPNPLRQ